MNRAKIQLSEDELQLALNESVILTKNLVIEKVCLQWEILSSLYKQVDLSFLPETIAAISPKISRGENYNGLPYVILDYPRYFTKQDIFAIRTMFWWGHDLSITLHLKGCYQQAFAAAITANLNQLPQEDWWLQHSGDEWQHHRNFDSHISLRHRQQHAILNDFEKREFIKIAGFVSLNSWNVAASIFSDRFAALINLLKNQAPNR